MTEKYLLESGVLRVKDGKFEKTNEEDAIYAAYARLLGKEFSDESDLVQKINAEVKGNKLEGVPAFLAFHEKVVELLKDCRTCPEVYKEALMLEKLEDNVAKHLPTYLQSRQRLEFMEGCLKNPKLYEYLCTTRGKRVEDKDFRAGVEQLYNGMAEKFPAVQNKFFDEFVEFNVREDVRFAAVNEKLAVRNA